MRKYSGKGIIIFIVILLLVLLFFVFKYQKQCYIKKDETIGENVYKNTLEFANTYNIDNQNRIEKQIQSLKKNRDITEPLIVYNAYGLNPYSCNFYFTTKDKVKVSYTIDANNTTYGNHLYNEIEYANEHAYQLIGLVPGYQNTITLTTETMDQKTEEYTFKMNVPQVDFLVPETNIIENTDESISDGLFAYLDLTYKKQYSNIYFINNDARICSAILIENVERGKESTNHGADRLIFKDGFMYYTFDDHKVAKMNRLGKVEDIYEWDSKYMKHHDIDIDFENNKIFALASDDTAGERLNLVLIYDMETRKTDIVNVSDIVSELYKKVDLDRIKVNKDYSEYIDFLHLNTVGINGDELTISSRSLSSIIVLKDIYNHPDIKYIIGPEEVFKDTPYQDKLLTKKGDFLIQLGQHTTERFFDNGNEYISLYNNNYGNDASITWVDWDKYEKSETKQNVSYYYLYQIDEEAKTFTLEKQIPVAYSRFMSSAQEYQGHHVIFSRESGTLGEYNEQGEVIRKYEFKDFFAYRVLKYDFNQFWFGE